MKIGMDKCYGIGRAVCLFGHFIIEQVGLKEISIEREFSFLPPMNKVQAAFHTVYQKSGGASMAKAEVVCENVFHSRSEEERRQTLTEIFVKLIQYFESSKIAS